MIQVLRCAALASILLVAAPARGESRLYEVRSGTYETRTMGVTDVVYFDEYGRKQARYSTVSFGGMPATHKLAIELPDGTSYDIDLDARTGTRMRIPPETAQAMAAAMAPHLTKDAKVKDLPARTYLGRSCKGIQAEAMGMVSRTWTWKGIPVHSEVGSAAAGKPIVVEVTKLAEGPVPAEKFQVPAGVAIQDVGAPGR